MNRPASLAICKGWANAGPACSAEFVVSNESRICLGCDLRSAWAVHDYTRDAQDAVPHKRAILQVHPRGNPQNPLTGVFATRSPVRPNLIALTLCKIVSIRENIVEVEKNDAFSGTPVLEIKPFIPGHDTATDAKNPDWLK